MLTDCFEQIEKRVVLSYEEASWYAIGAVERPRGCMPDELRCIFVDLEDLKDDCIFKIPNKILNFKVISVYDALCNKVGVCIVYKQSSHESNAFKWYILNDKNVVRIHSIREFIRAYYIL